MTRRRPPGSIRSLQRELAVQRKEHPSSLTGLLLLWLLISVGLGGWLWQSRWQELRSDQNRRIETFRGLLDLRVTSHKVTALDWSHWDQLHSFASGGDPGFSQREVQHSSIIRDGQVLVIAPSGGGMQSFPAGALTPSLRSCLQQRLQELRHRSGPGSLDQAYGFFCRAGERTYVGAGSTILTTLARGPVRGWLLHFSEMERPSYNHAVNAAFAEISAALHEESSSLSSDAGNRVSSVSELLPDGRSFALTPSGSALQLQIQALQETLLPWLSVNGLLAIAAATGLLAVRQLRLSQRLNDRRNHSRLRQLRQELPGPLLSQRELLERIQREGDSLAGCWIAAVRIRVLLFSGTFSRSKARTHALGQLGERLQRREGTRCLALGEESNLLLLFQPEQPDQPQHELACMAALLQELQERLAHSIKLRVNGLITPIDRVRPRQQLSDLALVLSQTSSEDRPMLFEPAGVAATAQQLRSQLQVDFSVSQLVENLRDHRYELEPVIGMDGARGQILYSEMLFRLPAEMDQTLTVQEVILSLERNNTIHLIDQLMLRKAIELLRQRHDPSLRLGINLSAVTFCSGQHFEDLISQLRALPEDLRGSLVMEVTETAIVEKSELWSLKLQQLRDLGVQIAIDDFGVGFASIAYLFRFRPDYLKLDLSYSQRLGDCNVDALVDFLLAYAHHNNCRLILEGIENRDQLEGWRKRGVRLFQGYLFHALEPGSSAPAP